MPTPTTTLIDRDILSERPVKPFYSYRLDQTLHVAWFHLGHDQIVIYVDWDGRIVYARLAAELQHPVWTAANH